MEIGLVYSENDPEQTATRDFLREFVRKHGMNATVSETKKTVPSPVVVINGETLKDLRRAPRKKNTPMFPSISQIAAALEQHLWSL